MNRKPLISVYTPTYNRGELLIERAIKSVLNQTYQNFEYIIVSDGSTDNTKELVEVIDDKRIRFFEIERGENHHNYDLERSWFLSGTIPSNFALDKVNGEWIARIDDDDIWTEDHLEKLLNFALENDYEFVSSQYERIKHGKRDIFEGIKLKDYFKEGSCETKIGGHSTWFYRGYLSEIKYDPECYKKEWNRVDHADMNYRMYSFGVRMGFLEEVTMYLYPRPGESTIGLEAVKEKMEGNKNG